MMEEYEPYLFRAAQLSDLDAIYAFSKVAGLTNLPPRREVLEAKIHCSIRCINNPPTQPHPDDFYFFVMENTQTNTLIGCCAIFGDIGSVHPFYSFRWDQNNNTLTLATELKNASEVAALYLSPEQRMHHMGAFLSRARYLWIASHMNSFHDTFIAEMRGREDKQNQSPFWELFIHKYIKNKSFQQADFDLARHEIEFVDELIPHVPIAVETMDKRAQACIGIPHINTRAAVNLLIHEGFAITDHINIIDAGPILKAETNNIHTIQDSFTLAFLGEREPASQEVYFIATTATPFYVALSKVEIDLDKHACYLAPSVAQRLQLKIHDTLRLSIF